MTGNHASDRLSPFEDDSTLTLRRDPDGILRGPHPHASDGLNGNHSFVRPALPMFRALRDDTPPEAEPCKCGLPGCPDGEAAPAPAGTDVLLSCAPGVTDRMWLARISNGAYDDTESLWDTAHSRVHQPALKTGRRIHADVAAGLYDISAMLDRTPALHTDPGLAEGWQQMEELAPRRHARVQDWVARRAAWWRDDEAARWAA